MKIKNTWLRKEVILPTKHEIIFLLILLFLPNLFFLTIAFYTETARPLVNLDYIVALFFILLPYRITKSLGIIILVFSIIFDILMFVVQIFPFMNLSAIRYLSTYIFDAPINYIFFSIGCMITIIFIIALFLYLSKKIQQPYPSFILIILLILGGVFMTLDISYARFYGILGRDNYYIAHSQSVLYSEITHSEFSDWMNTKPQLEYLEQDQKRGLNSIKVPYSSKILLIVAESWGELRDIKAQKTIVKNIFEQEDKLESLSLGSFYTVGATVSGELRELCGLRIVNNGFALNQINKDVFSDCIPNKLKQQNYTAIALHGTSGLLYDRIDWYPKAGFQNVLFGENFLGLHRCAPFKGVCDAELMHVVAKKFEENTKNSLFFYWMTLTSHQPYAKQDIYNQRFNCEKFAINPNGDVCHNAQLQTQFFDDLAKLIQKPEMKGTEVIVVGDHQPPIWGEDVKHIRPLTVGYLHFKIKESN